MQVIQRICRNLNTVFRKSKLHLAEETWLFMRGTFSHVPRWLFFSTPSLIEVYLRSLLDVPAQCSQRQGASFKRCDRSIMRILWYLTCCQRFWSFIYHK